MSIRIVRGRPTDEELAALVAVLLSRTTAADAPPPPSLWRDHTALLRAPLMASRGSWRASSLPY